MAEPIELVIFDCDGVLVDSEPLAIRLLLELIAAQGIAVSAEEAYRDFLGRSLKSISESLEESRGMALGPDALEGMRAGLYALYRRELQPTAHMAQTLDRLGVPFCVASSSSIERIRVSLDVTGLLERFDGRIFSASMVTNGKPAPDLFLHAARQMGVEPARCVVIEDSPAGIRAAKAAGMRVFAFRGGGHVAPAGLAEAVAVLDPDASFDDMRMLPALLALHATRARGEPPRLLAAVDVGTASARAAIIDAGGGTLARSEAPIAVRRPAADRAEYDSEGIWAAVGACVRAALRESGARPDEVAGLAFDATCSLVIRTADGAPLPVSPGSEPRWDTISWFDHRARAEAEECTETDDPVLDRLGGSMSPEMQPPKLMWLKRHMPESWAQLGMAFDLGDFLHWRATGATARSACAAICKWGYDPEANAWPEAFFAAAGLADLTSRAGLPEHPMPVGTVLGTLTASAASELGLTEHCTVAAGFVDAHAGHLGALGELAADTTRPARHMVLVAGTSSAILAVAPQPREIEGVWGPFRDAILPGLWLHDGGQSATGALLDHVIRSHPAGGEPTPALHAVIESRIEALLAEHGPGFGGRLHVVPDFHGNRAPLADAEALGVLWGLDLAADFDALCRLYWRCAIGLALGVRHVLDALAAGGYDTARVHIAGGHLRSHLFRTLYANATGRVLVEPDAPDATLLGTAMAAAVAAGIYPELGVAANAMASGNSEHAPDPALATWFDGEYAIFLLLLEQRRNIAELEEWRDRGAIVAVPVAAQ